MNNQQQLSNFDKICLKQFIFIHDFSSEKECFEYITTNVITTFVVCSDKFTEFLSSSQVSDFNHVHSIYIYSTSNKNSHDNLQKLQNRYCKIKGLYTNIMNLIEDLHTIVESFTICQMFNPNNPESQNTTDDFGSWWVGYLDILCHLEYPDDYLKRLVHTLKVY
ncbi:unnamed protein product [Adineta ricciae]|uniref:Uncharacterized protein n=1 Tax=Adineta ricciae TaxID=249248 RepID=A0A815C6A7_ADIRI|nr:unnamed protein product [Adineta ricciae]CAF1493773.1 unnamed protein product [Adineta ricciae]